MISFRKLRNGANLAMVPRRNRLNVFENSGIQLLKVMDEVDGFVWPFRFVELSTMQ